MAAGAPPEGDRLPAAARALCAGDSDYPAALLDLPDPPRVLYARGRLPAPARTIAIVGSRAASPYGAAMARRLAADLAGLGYGIVSGLARGIDAAAHRGALEAGGASFAVLPGGLEDITPRHHRELAERLCARGGLCSERAAGPPPGPGGFVKRNRLIAALGAATVVVEAAERSGALSTAAAAWRLRRPLLAVPGDADRPTARGTLGLLRRGAALCDCAGDVVAALGVNARWPADEAERFGNPPEARLAAALEYEPRGAEQLATAAGLALEETLATLLRLEWAGVAAVHPGPRWARRGS